MNKNISVFIITYNEEERVRSCLESIAGIASEIIVVDCYSSDRTCEIAKEYGAKIFHRFWCGYGSQKRFAEEMCSNDWVLNIDADEMVTRELQKEIARVLERDAKPCAYKIPILTVYPGRSKPRMWANDYNVVRLYHRSIGTYADSPIHDRVEVKEGITKQLRSPVYHFTHLSVRHSVQKALNYSLFRVEKASCPNYDNYNWFRLIFEFPIVFLKFYIFRRHFTGGWMGYYFSLSYAFMRTTRIAMMLERKEMSKLTGKQISSEGKIDCKHNECNSV